MPRWPLALLLFTAPALAQDKPLPPSEAALRMTLPPGFKATLFAGEPDLVQPIAFTFDDRGRLWGVECLSYPNWRADGTGKDRVVVLEDTDGDGKFDKKTVVLDNGSNLSGIEYGFGGIWLCSVPNLLFVPIGANDKPSGPPKVVLDGWNLKDTKHNIFNSLIWGPDGWLWGCNGIQAKSLVGAPGTPDAKSVPINCGVWRYHPTHGTFEAVAHGTTNPFGLDFNEFGEAFMTNCVIGHLWHVVPGGRYERMYGQDFNPYAYALMPTCADHKHWAGGDWTTSRGGQGAHSDAGGGHAHSGCHIYLGDNWPAEYRGGVLMGNIHGNRLNFDQLERRGSTYVGKHRPDPVQANDPWFRPIMVKGGPEGGVYVSDWTDTGECHNYVVADTKNGRIFRIVHGTPKAFHGDLAKLSDTELVKLLDHPNEWHTRHARRLLQERARTLKPETRDALWATVTGKADVSRKLRAVWTLHATGWLDDDKALSLLERPEEYLRAWAVRLAVDFDTPHEALMAYLQRLASAERSALVRREMMSALPRFPAKMRGALALSLARGEDATDPFASLLLWYGLTSTESTESSELLLVILQSKLPLLREYAMRRLAARSPDGVRTAVYLLANTGPKTTTDETAAMVRGLAAALHGVRRAPLPDNWPPTFEKLLKSESAETRDLSRKLAVIFGDAAAVKLLRQELTNAQLSPNQRLSALSALQQQQSPDLVPLLFDLLPDANLRGPAARGLAAFNDSATAAKLLAVYATSTDDQKADIVQTLAARPPWALALLDAIEKGQVPRRDVSAFVVRQVQGLKDKTVAERLTKVWGSVRPASADKAKRLAELKAKLTPDVLAQADTTKGKALYVKTCASCHKLFGDGGAIGPELTGSQRANLDYLLENVLDPSAVVPNEYKVTALELVSGRVVTGIVKAETDKALTVQTPNELLTFPKSEIETRKQLPVSLMPEGQLDTLSAADVRDLVGYLVKK